MEETAIWGT